MRTPKALVTGCSGFIGRHFVRILLEKGYDVTGLVRATSRLDPLKRLNIHLVKGDICDPRSLHSAAADRDFVFHLAAALAAPDRNAYQRSNVEGTENLLEACREVCPGIKKFVYVSSIAAAGPSRKGETKMEDDPCRPVSEYGRSKLAAESLVQRYGKWFPVTLIRPPNVLGAGQKELTIVMRLIDLGIVPRLADREKRTSLCFVEDLAEALILAAESPHSRGRTYFVTDGRAYSWTEITDILARQMGRKLAIPVPASMVSMTGFFAELAGRLTGRPSFLSRSALNSVRERYWIFNSERIRKELGFRPSIGLEDGLKRIVSEYRAEKICKAVA